MISPQPENPTSTHTDITPEPIQLNDLGSKLNMSSTNVSIKGDDKGDARHLEQTNDLASSHPHLIVSKFNGRSCSASDPDRTKTWSAQRTRTRSPLTSSF